MDQVPQTDESPKREFAKPPRRRGRGGELILRSTAVLPAMCTILHALSGFAAIHFATKSAAGEEGIIFNLSVAAWLIFVAMLFDMLDGRLARLTRRTSDFGGQLDSLADVISFGVAPAILMLRTVSQALGGHIERIGFLPALPMLERVVWCIGATYVACAVLRLARFNVENEPDESAHVDFRGLPSPGAAAPVAALVLLFGHLGDIEKGWRSAPWAMIAVGVTLPLVTLAGALLMVARFKYPHIVNQYIRGKRPFGYIVKLVVVLLAGMLEPFVAMALGTLAYMLSGPICSLWRAVRRRRKNEEMSNDQLTQ